MTFGRTFAGVAAAGSLAASLLVVSALPAAATIDKGTCTATATASQSGSIDLTTKSTWTLVMADTVNGKWQGPTQTHLSIGADIFGLSIPVYSSTGKNTQGSAGPFNVADYANYGRVIAVAGTSDDCHGYLTIVISDASPLTNYLSLISIALLILGLLVLLMLAFSRPSTAKRIVGLLFGLVAGVGGGILLIEIGTLDPTSLAGLAFPIGGAIVGIIVPGIFFHTPAAAAPAAPAV